MSSALHMTVIGSVNLDFIIQTTHLPTAGETVTRGQFNTLPGGKGANVAVMAKRLGADVTLNACVGDDIYADEALVTAVHDGVDISAVHRLPEAATGVAFINVSEEGENQIAVASGANMAFSPTHISTTDTHAIITQFEVPEDTILEAIKNRDVFVCLNASPVGPNLAPLLPFVDLLIVNEGEYAGYQAQLADFAGDLAITLGARGAKLIRNGQDIATSTPPKVDVVDTTGAGDNFAAALTLAYLEGQSPQNALNFACSAGALTTTKLGTQAAAPSRRDVDAYLLKHLQSHPHDVL